MDTAILIFIIATVILILIGIIILITGFFSLSYISDDIKRRYDIAYLLGGSFISAFIALILCLMIILYYWYLYKYCQHKMVATKGPIKMMTLFIFLSSFLAGIFSWNAYLLLDKLIINIKNDKLIQLLKPEDDINYFINSLNTINNVTMFFFLATLSSFILLLLVTFYK